uniref:Cytochrome c oxidase subunit 7C, mitochondrial n=2 Tax=Timema TaxID=61471 RepID=A0A7R9JB67_TIMCA|nr:unnamed protein product [Timema californicum]
MQTLGGFIWPDVGDCDDITQGPPEPTTNNSGIELTGTPTNLSVCEEGAFSTNTKRLVVHTRVAGHLLEVPTGYLWKAGLTSPGTAAKMNLPFSLNNRFRLTAWFILFFGSGLAAPFLVVRHQLLKK